ncbi:hypothetical protein C0Z20_02330 [Trinickia symbiotica]|uniref:Uncharacterized protein n=1 Tax=Trinickia symbiotica TaxID=863227 RepID=A0A2N7XAB7_9BURK|nr:hypothetical protein C0Z20_02330 [Trinickia symbiotica]
MFDLRQQIGVVRATCADAHTALLQLNQAGCPVLASPPCHVHKVFFVRKILCPDSARSATPSFVVLRIDERSVEV